MADVVPCALIGIAARLSFVVVPRTRVVSRDHGGFFVIRLATPTDRGNGATVSFDPDPAVFQRPATSKRARKSGAGRGPVRASAIADHLDALGDAEYESLGVIRALVEFSDVLPEFLRGAIDEPQGPVLGSTTLVNDSRNGEVDLLRSFGYASQHAMWPNCTIESFRVPADRLDACIDRALLARLETLGLKTQVDIEARLADMLDPEDFAAVSVDVRTGLHRLRHAFVAGIRITAATDEGVASSSALAFAVDTQADIVAAACAACQIVLAEARLGALAASMTRTRLALNPSIAVAYLAAPADVKKHFVVDPRSPDFVEQLFTFATEALPDIEDNDIARDLARRRDEFVGAYRANDPDRLGAVRAGELAALAADRRARDALRALHSRAGFAAPDPAPAPAPAPQTRQGKPDFCRTVAARFGIDFDSAGTDHLVALGRRMFEFSARPDPPGEFERQRRQLDEAFAALTVAPFSGPQWEYSHEITDELAVIPLDQPAGEPSQSAGEPSQPPADPRRKPDAAAEFARYRTWTHDFPLPDFAQSPPASPAWP